MTCFILTSQNYSTEVCLFIQLEICINIKDISELIVIKKVDVVK